MRIMILLPALLLSVSASAEAPSKDSPIPARPVLRDRVELANPGATPVCHDRIEEVRDSRGLPKLQRDTAAPDEPLLLAAVDKRIGGCSVLVMRNNLSDIRPLPEYRNGPAQLKPLAGQ
uniref:hypothetical protein n=1 Tax=Altererythrobacter segetis TaxID=1104773 RepID=UPI00140AA062|nr:hypothetical protein [Altererythrobacter segetis]